VFEGWEGACTGTQSTCVVIVNDEMAVGALFRGPQTMTLAVTGLQNGTGVVFFEPPGSGCANAPGPEPATCQHAFRVGTPVTLTAQPALDSVFDGWTGACEGAQPTCQVTVTDDLVVGARFRGPEFLTVQVSAPENGDGSVLIVPAAQNCLAPQTCVIPIRPGTVTLHAYPSFQSVFEGWSGACTGTGQVNLTEALTVGASFRGPQRLTLEMAADENGAGSVVVSQLGLICSLLPGAATQTCTGLAPVGTEVQLYASAFANSAFLGWTGSCTGTNPICVVTMADDLTIGASFRGPQTLTLVVEGEGSGQVVVDPLSATCQNAAGSATTCAYPIAPGTLVRLAATPAADSLFQGWQGACAGQGPLCDVTLADELTTNAVFVLRNHPPTANAGGPYTGVRNQAIAFNGGGSSYPDYDTLT
jgi:hypothetical protein